MPNFVPAGEGEEDDTLIGTADFADCNIVERRLVMDGATPRLRYHRTGEVARVFGLSETADEIPDGAIAIATMTDEGYWELTAVMC